MIVRDFYDTAFNRKKPEEAVARYMGPAYIQHNPSFGDGPETFIADIFRLENDKVINHWDLIHEVAGHAANPNGMF